MFRRRNQKAAETQLSIPAKARLKRELSILNSDPPPGIAAYLPCSDDMSKIRAEIEGAEDSPFEKGVFVVSVQIRSRYPFEPPQCRFITPIFHPNIDDQGRICLDTLKSPPAGSWSPAVSLPSLLLTLRTLMSNPNPEDGLVPEISDLFRRDPQQWRKEARLRTLREALPLSLAGSESGLKGVDESKTELKNLKRPQTNVNKTDSEALNNNPQKKMKLVADPASEKKSSLLGEEKVKGKVPDVSCQQQQSLIEK